ncbi:hypothetical protein [Tessaracoccus caeni]|uniref:hypothetical protein n=1 Tax=Tessaracoccus caeni TaxID=3031239 RepID=UPI0023D9EB3C|nr:hypothetical protein [Tessaracoccus caeni]MDF1487243.1 hypothetical protein [Tessaracoccus caeni]
MAKQPKPPVEKWTKGQQDRAVQALNDAIASLAPTAAAVPPEIQVLQYEVSDVLARLRAQTTAAGWKDSDYKKAEAAFSKAVEALSSSSPPVPTHIVELRKQTEKVLSDLKTQGAGGGNG